MIFPLLLTVVSAIDDVKVVSCNAEDGKIEMTIHIERKLFDVKPDTMTVVDDVWYEEKFTRDDLQGPIFVNDKLIRFERRVYYQDTAVICILSLLE